MMMHNDEKEGEAVPTISEKQSDHIAKSSTEIFQTKASLNQPVEEEQQIPEMNQNYESGSGQEENEPTSNRFQSALQKLKTLKSNKKFSQEYEQPIFSLAVQTPQGESPEQNFSRRGDRKTQRQGENPHTDEVEDFRPPYLQQRYGTVNNENTSQTQRQAISDQASGNDQSFCSDIEDDSEGTSQVVGKNFKRRISRAMDKLKDSQIESRRQTLNQADGGGFKPHSKNVGFDNEDDLGDAVMNSNKMNQFSLLRNASSKIKADIQVQNLNSSPNPLTTSRSSIIKNQHKRGPSGSLKEGAKILLEELGGKGDMEASDEDRDPEILKYCQAISLQYHGDMKTTYPIHSQSPYSDKVEISNLPKPRKLAASVDYSSKKYQPFRDFECAAALKSNGEIFRILPASDFQNLNKIKKILKNKVELEFHDHYKYGEYLESLGEEIRYNLGVFEEFKNMPVKFGSSVMFLHENSQQFLKISSPNLSDQHQNFKLELTSVMSDKTIFKLIPSNKIQQEGDGSISETDQFFIGYTYDKILNKDLFLYQDPTLLERQTNKSPMGLNKSNQTLLRLVFSEEKKLPFHFSISALNNFEKSQNIFKHLNGKIIQIKHIESDLYLTLTIKRKENRVLNLFFSDKNRYQLNKLIDHLPESYGQEATCNIHFEPRSSINTYWKIIAFPHHKDKIQLENAVSKIRLKPMHIQMRSKGQQSNPTSEFELLDQEGIFYKFFTIEKIASAEINLQLRASILDQQNVIEQQRFIWVEYLKYNKQENKYEFSKFGSLNDEDKGNLFDSFKIHEVDVYKSKAFEFLSYCFNSFRQFDFNQADNEESMEYEKILGVIQKLKKFVRNKLEGFMIMEEPSGKPFKGAQSMLKEAFIIDELAELVDNVWPDEAYLKQDFTGQAFSSREQRDMSDIKSYSSKSSSSMTSKSGISQADEDPHRDSKMLLAEKIFELLRLIVEGNLMLQEYVFFEIVPNLLKFFGAGFRDNQDYELFNYLVKNCDTFADYKEKTKYNIIFQFIRKLKKENSYDIEINLFSILRSFCINSKGEANNYHQKLLHDMFFNNEVQGIKFKVQEKKTSKYKSTVKATSVIDDKHEAKSVQKIQKDLRAIEQQRDSFIKSRSMRDKQVNNQSQNVIGDGNKFTTARADYLDVITESRRDHSHNEDIEESKNALEGKQGIPIQKANDPITPFKQRNKGILEEQDLFKQSQGNKEQVQYETVDESMSDFLIKQLHQVTLDKVSEEHIMSNCRDTELLRIELYFFADLCYHMNFGCTCSTFSNATVQNILRLLTDKKSILDTNLKAGLTRILNTILRNNDDNHLQRPYFSRIYEKQEFQKPSIQKILTTNDVRTLVKFTRMNFRKLSVDGIQSFSEFDSEIMRLTQYLIQSNLIFEKDFQEGYNYVQDIFEDVSRLHIKISTNGDVTSRNAAKTQTAVQFRKQETSLNLDDFEKQNQKIMQLLESQMNPGDHGLQMNPFAWKLQNIQKIYSTYVEDLVSSERSNNLMKNDMERELEKMEGARLETVKFFQWLLNLRVDSLLSNIVNMFFSQLESFLEREDSDLDQLIKHPERYFTFQCMQRLMSDMLSGLHANGQEQHSFLSEIMKGGQKNNQGEVILDLEEMYQEFLKQQMKQDSIKNSRAGFSSPIRQHFLTEGDEVSQSENSRGNYLENNETPRKRQTQFVTEIEEEQHKVFEMVDMKEELEHENEIKQAELQKDLRPQTPSQENLTSRAYNFLKVNILALYSKYKQKKIASETQDSKQAEKLNQRRQFLDILIDIFVNTASPIIQQETIRAIYKCLNLRRQLLHDLSQTILIFKQADKGKIIKANQALKNIRLICLDSTTWEIPSQNEQNNPMTPSLTNALNDLDAEDLEPPIAQSNTHLAQSSSKQKKQEYAQKIKEHQKNQQQLIQQLSFTKSNKSTVEKIKQIELLIENLEILNDFLIVNQNSKHNFKGISNSSYKNQVEKYEAYLRAIPAEELDSHLSFVQNDLQYSFLAIQGQQILMKFVKAQQDLRQECMRIIFFGTKPAAGRIFSDIDCQNQRIQFAVKVLVAYKKCYEILIKFVYNNKTAKKVMLEYLEDVLLFNSEYYMQSKMLYQITLYEFELLNYILQDNTRIASISQTLSTQINNLVQFVNKIIEFPKKPFMLSPMILKVYSSIIASCNNPKINDSIVDIILREEVFFQIQSLLLGINMKKSRLSPCEQLNLIEKFLGGISQILQNSNVRMIKKKFYQIFSKLNNQETYFNHLRELFTKSCDYLKTSLQSSGSESASKIGKMNPLLAKSQSKSILTRIDEEIKMSAQKFLRVESYLIIIFNKLFFDVKGTAKQIQDKVEEIRTFIGARERDINILDSYNISNLHEWPELKLFEFAIQECHEYCTKNLPKIFQLSATNKKTIQRTQTLLSQYNMSSRRSSTKDMNLKGLSLLNQSGLKVQDKLQKEDSNESFHTYDSASSEASNKLKSSFQMRMNSLASSVKSNQLATKKEQVFKLFKWKTMHDDNIKLELKKEQRHFSEVLLKKFKLADENASELGNQRYYMFFEKLVQYSNLFLEDKEKLKDTQVLVEIFSQFIDLTNEAQSYKGEGFEAKTIIQEKLHSIGAVQMSLDMMCSENNEQIDELFPQLLYFSNRILDGADNNIQDFFTNYLTRNEKAINLFERCFNLIDKEIQNLRKISQSQIDGFSNSASALSRGQNQKVPKVYDKKINVQKQILKFFKNLCENHNTKMQLLVGNQQHPDKNFDMVSLTVNYLHALISNINLSKQNYSNAQNCCISLAEYIQGPCFVNQNRIKDANFYQLAIQILSLKPQLEEDKAKKEKDCVRIDLDIQKRISINAKIQIQTKFDISQKDASQEKKQKESDEKSQQAFTISNFMIQKLKLNCTIILISLLEQRSSDDPLLLSMKRSIPLDIIKQNIVYEYFLFCKDYKKFLSRENFFRHVLTQSDHEVQEELIIEVGFNLYFLLKRWSEHKKTNDNQLEDLMNIIEQEQQVQNAIFGTFYDIQKLCFALSKDVKKLYHMYISGQSKGKAFYHSRTKLKMFLETESNLNEALVFFKTNSASIDVLVKTSIEQVQFPYMPYCTYLSEEEKVEFYNDLPTDRDKEKIEVLVNTSTDLIRRMKIEYQFKKFFFGYPIIGELVYHTELWKTLAFYVILMLNVMNLYSFSASNDHDRLYNPVFFSLSTEATQFVYLVLGLIQIALSILINFTIISKRVIYHYQLTFDEKRDDGDKSDEQNHTEGDQLSYWKKSKREIFKDFKNYTLSAIQDFQLLYYLGYLFFTFVGFLCHPFFYAYHMIDMIVRNPYLKNVLTAVYRPRYELFNTVILFLCLQYIFAMISYVYFFEDFEKGECTSLSQCFLVIIDQTFKNDGGIGTFLQRAYPEEMGKGGGISMLRFTFDNTFNVLLVILVVEIISGIIIDTFGALREEHNKITESIENKCMICGRNRDQIEKEYQDMIANEESQGGASSSNKKNEERAFDMHKKYKHNIYDYIFFLAYLSEKPELEYTGLESFVSEKYEEKNNTWFPIYKVGGDRTNAQSQSGLGESDDSGNSENESEQEDEEADQKVQTTLKSSEHQTSGAKALESQQAQTNKLIIDCLLQINSQLETINDNIAVNNNTSRMDLEESNLFMGNAGLSMRQTGVQNRRETSASRQQTMKPKNQNSNFLMAQQNIQTGTLRTSGSNQVSRQNSNRFQKAKNQINAMNAYLK